MRDLLHDEIDEIEALAQKARQATIEIVERELPAALERTGNITAAMVEVAQIVEARMADLTTEAFETGVNFSQKRNEVE